MAADQRVSVGIRASYHRELSELAGKTNHKVGALVDLALRNFLKDVAPVYRRAVEEIEGARKK